VVAARLLPGQRPWNGSGPARAIRQAGDQGCCGVEVRGFEPLASSVRVSDALPLCGAAFSQVALDLQGRSLAFSCPPPKPNKDAGPRPDEPLSVGRTARVA
jgi:hypothetical protein